MAKEKKDKALKVPKRIAGVKVPKKVRKTANKALAVARNPAARDLAVAALTAAAAALAERKVDGTAARPGSPGEPGIDERAGTLTDVVIAAALDGARRLLDGIDAPQASRDEEPKPAAASAAPAEPAAP